MPSRPARPQLGLFDNPAGAFRLEELTETVRALERQRPGRTIDELSRAVFAELAMKRTRRSAELVAEAIRLARARATRRDRRLAVAGQHSGSPELGAERRLRDRPRREHPDRAITACNQTHPGQPY